jgi:hypothetical protein
VFAGSTESASTQLRIPRVKAFSVPFGVRVWSKNGTKIPPLTNAKFRMNLSAVGEIADLISVTGPCTIYANQVNCDFGSLEAGTHLYSLTLQAHPGASHDRQQFDMTATGTEKNGYSQPTRYGGVTVSYEDQLADVVTSNTPLSGRVGDTITTEVTIRNNGPDDDPWVEHSTTYLPAEVVVAGLEGCDEQSFTETSFNCRQLNLGSGGPAKTFRLSLRIVSCAKSVQLGASFGSAIDSPYPGHFSPLYIPIKINGC